jgi:unsaturated chondroitin disaccharide hydrolase
MKHIGEIAKSVGEHEGGMYMNAAVNILKALEANFIDYDPETDAMLGHGTVLYPKNEKQMSGLHISIIYADFFYTEAILKLLGSEFNPWMK